jgi:hypothetical protein
LPCSSTNPQLSVVRVYTNVKRTDQPVKYMQQQHLIGGPLQLLLLCSTGSTDPEYSPAGCSSSLHGSAGARLRPKRHLNPYLMVSQAARLHAVLAY